MIHSPDEAMLDAAEMKEPVAVFDPANGSLSGRFFLMEWHWREMNRRPTQMFQAADFEMTRRCFNEMRDKGMLVTDKEQRRHFHPQCQAWPVVVD